MDPPRDGRRVRRLRRVRPSTADRRRRRRRGRCRGYRPRSRGSDPTPSVPDSHSLPLSTGPSRRPRRPAVLASVEARRRRVSGLVPPDYPGPIVGYPRYYFIRSSGTALRDELDHGRGARTDSEVRGDPAVPTRSPLPRAGRRVGRGRGDGAEPLNRGGNAGDRPSQRRGIDRHRSLFERSRRHTPPVTGPSPRLAATTAPPITVPLRRRVPPLRRHDNRAEIPAQPPKSEDTRRCACV